jgi:hypothetical protein
LPVNGIEVVPSAKREIWNASYPIKHLNQRDEGSDPYRYPK